MLGRFARPDLGGGRWGELSHGRNYHDGTMMHKPGQVVFLFHMYFNWIFLKFNIFFLPVLQQEVESVAENGHFLGIDVYLLSSVF